jgi:hypothetical protein
MKTTSLASGLPYVAVAIMHGPGGAIGVGVGDGVSGLARAIGLYTTSNRIDAPIMITITATEIATIMFFLIGILIIAEDDSGF